MLFAVAARRAFIKYLLGDRFSVNKVNKSLQISFNTKSILKGDIVLNLLIALIGRFNSINRPTDRGNASKRLPDESWF